jgi:threonine aldolase
VELQTGGARLVSLPSRDGRLDPAVLERELVSRAVSVHSLQPAAVTLAQVTECGTVYRPEHLAEIARVAHARQLPLHVDGARFANALASLGATPAELSWQAGVDVLSFGATKNGALAAEAVVFFDTSRVRDFELRRKRAAQLFSKMRYLSAQLLACLEGDFFLANARRANALAARIAAAAGSRLLHPAEANLLFLRLLPAEADALCKQGFEFHPWGPADGNGYRFVVSWDQPDADVDALCKALHAWT